MNKIIFCGAFDPIHNGHLEMAKIASQKLKGDVIFVPSVVSIWKNDSIPFSHKLEMIKIMLKNEKNMSVSDYEGTTGEKYNYSINTVKHFKNLYPNDKLYFIVGLDQVNEFHRWKDALELSKLVNIVYFTRPGSVFVNDNVKTYKMSKICDLNNSASSTNIKAMVDLDTKVEVLDYIGRNNLYYMNRINEYLKPERRDHSLEVAKLAMEIASSNNLERPHKYYLAGLLHDIGKEINRNEQERIMDAFYPSYKKIGAFAYHQFVGEYIAKNKFIVNDEDILKAIKFHATGNENMSVVGRIIYAADKIEPTREFDSTSLIQACLLNHELGFIEVLKANKEFLILNNKDYSNVLTVACFDCYLK